MVVYKVKENFYHDTMSQIRELRQNGLLCDVALTVGQDILSAHRCVLATGSQYFRSLFLGQFKEASMPNVNMSDVADDVKDLELVVNFMYMGEIDIDESNLGVLVQLSSFLMIDPLRQFCSDYMMKHLCLKNCLRFYLHAHMNGLTCVGEKASKMVVSRFHDYIIFYDNLELSPDEVLYLLDDGIYAHCTALKMVNFVSLWLKNGITQEHISVANQLLDKVAIETVVPVSNGTETVEPVTNVAAEQQKLAVMEEVLKGQTGDEAKRLFQKAQTIYAEADSKQGSSLAKNKTFMDEEEVLVTLSPKQCLVDVYNPFLPEDTIKEPVLDLCCYVPRTKTWYHIRDLKPWETGYFNQSEDDSQKYLHQLCIENLITVMYKEELVMIDGDWEESAEVHFYNIRNKSNRKVEITEPDDILLEENETLRHNGFSYNCFVTDDHSLYLIYKVNIHIGDEHDAVGEYFRCVRLEKDGWETVFRTDVERNRAFAGGILQAKISSVSNEMIFTCGPTIENGYSYVFVVDLNKEHPVPVNVFTMPTEWNEHVLTGVKITQSSSHFYIVQDGTVDSIDGDVQIMMEYKFNSQRLTKPEREIITVNHLSTCISNSYPYMEEMAAASDNTLWLFQGADTFTSVLTEYETKSDGSVACTVHTPPPFFYMTAMFNGKLTVDLLTDATPIERFLLSGTKSDC